MGRGVGGYRGRISKNIYPNTKFANTSAVQQHINLGHGGIIDPSRSLLIPDYTKS